MSDLSANVTWREILKETEAGNIPQCRAICAPLKWHDEIIESLSRLILGSYRPSHPDLIIIGTGDKPPVIGDPAKANYEGSCRWLIENFALMPMESKRRFAVVRCADKLNVQAANSLLKLAEEPPNHGVILFLMEDGRLFLPTLKSRSHYSVLISDERVNPKRMPENSAEWLEWLRTARKNNDSESVTGDLEGWCENALRSGNVALSERIERLKIISSRKNLSVPMLCDVIILTLREEKGNYERILDDIW